MISIGQPYKRFTPDEPYDTLVIGSGIGGLAVAALLSKHAGQKVLVLEQHYTAGGYTHVFQRGGYEWDVGVHYIGDVGHPRSGLRVMLDDICDEPIEWEPMGEVYDRIVLGDEVFDYVAGRDAFIERMAGYFPKERDAIASYVDLVQRAQRTVMPFMAEKALPKPVAAVMGGRMRRDFEAVAARTTREVLEELTSDQRLIAVLTGQYGDYGLPPDRSSFAIHAMVAGHYLGGGYFPVGGSSRFAACIVPTIEKAGGAVVVRAEVERVLVEGRKAVGVRMADGRELRAARVISDAGVFNTFEKLLPPETAAAIAGSAPDKSRIQRSVGHLGLYLGFQKTAAELGCPRANYWLYPDEHHERNVDAFAADPEAPFPVVYVSFPAAKDPDFERRFPGRATIDIITMAPYEWFERWEGTKWHKRGEDYDALKQRFTDRLLEHLYRWVPATRGAIDHSELSTPLTSRHFAAWQRGELYGLDHTPARFTERALRPRTAIKNLFLTGQDVCTAGIGGALFGGVLTASAVLGKDMSKVARQSLGR